MKLMIYLGIVVCGTIGGWLGAALDDGNWFGALSIVGSTIGAFVGLGIGYKVGQSVGS